MKAFIKQCLITFSLIIIAVYLVFGFINWCWNDFNFAMQVLVTTVVIYLGRFVSDKFKSSYHIFEILVEFAMVLTVVLTFGWIFKWYQLSYAWIIVLIVVMVYTASYILDIARTKKNVDFINKQIMVRKERIAQHIGTQDSRLDQEDNQ